MTENENVTYTVAYIDKATGAQKLAITGQLTEPQANALCDLFNKEAKKAGGSGFDYFVVYND